MRLLLLNPPIYDFAAYNFWMKPFGLLQLASALKKSGASVSLFDFCDPLHPSVRSDIKRDEFGRGKLPSEVVELPDVFEGIRRRFRRYGLPRHIFERFLDGERFDAALITSSMTYWYPGLFEVVALLKERYGERFPIFVGGTYATLCTEHLKRNLSVDGVWTPSGWLGQEFPVPGDFSAEVADFSHYSRLSFGVTRLTRGCPFRCSYCAVRLFEDRLRRRELDAVFEELEHFAARGVVDVAFYDDALLVDSEHFTDFVERLRMWGHRFRFHTPNALHASCIDADTAELLESAGFETIYIGCECADEAILAETGGKVSFRDVEDGVHALLGAGFSPHYVTLYLLVGHPKMDYEVVEASVERCMGLGVRIMLAEYSPVPKTEDGEEALRLLGLDASDEPLFTNNTYFTELALGDADLQALKERVRNHNRSVCNL